MKLLRGIALVVGAIVGVGFISGAELTQFFPRVFPFALLFFCGALCLLVLYALYLGERYGGFYGTVRALFPRSSSAIFTCFSLGSLVSCAGILAAFDALLPTVRPLASLLGLCAAAIVVRRGASGVARFSLYLVPVVACFLLVRVKFISLPAGVASFGGKTLLYAGYNFFLSFPVLCEAGREYQRGDRIAISLIACILVGAFAFVVLGNLTGAGEEVTGQSLPFAALLKGNKLFLFICSLAIFTTLSCATFSLLSACERLKKRKNAAKGLTLLATFLLSRVGITRMIAGLYPPLGVAGLLYLVLCILHEKLLQKHDEKVHSRRKQTENTGCAHHQIKLKHLPAVHD